MKIKTLLIILVFLFGKLAFAQDAPNIIDASGKKQGHWIKFDQAHKKLYDGNFKDNYPVGKFTYYYDSGIPWAVTIFYKNGKVAYTKMYDAGGNLTGEGKYIDEKKDSIWKFYNSEGKVISDETYVNGKKNGVCRVYYSNGQIAEEKTWKNGIADGKWKKYFDTGIIKYDGQYKNDKVDGHVKFYFPNGNVESEGNYLDDLKEGVWKYNKEDGTLKSKDTFIKGRSCNPDKDVITNQQLDKDKKQNEGSEIKDPYQDGYSPPH
jgi:antitoxin component YwqK of YwqJK toxin-antitoxin module